MEKAIKQCIQRSMSPNFKVMEGQSNPLVVTGMVRVKKLSSTTEDVVGHHFSKVRFFDWGSGMVEAHPKHKKQFSIHF